MGDMGDDFKAWEEFKKAQRQENLSKANPEGWTQHTPWHWSRQLNNLRLDYWPSKNKFMYCGKVMVGDVISFIKSKEKT